MQGDFYRDSNILGEEKQDIFTSCYDTSDFRVDYCEYEDRFMTICLRLKRPTFSRIAIFNFIAEIEAREKELVGHQAKAFTISEWTTGNIIFFCKLYEDANANKMANFISSGMQVRYGAAVNQGEQIKISDYKKKGRHPYRCLRRSVDPITTP